MITANFETNPVKNHHGYYSIETNDLNDHFDFYDFEDKGATYFFDDNWNRYGILKLESYYQDKTIKSYDSRLNQTVFYLVTLHYHYDNKSIHKTYETTDKYKAIELHRHIYNNLRSDIFMITRNKHSCMRNLFHFYFEE